MMNDKIKMDQLVTFDHVNKGNHDPLYGKAPQCPSCRELLTREPVPCYPLTTRIKELAGALGQYIFMPDYKFFDWKEPTMEKEKRLERIHLGY